MAAISGPKPGAAAFSDSPYPCRRKNTMQSRELTVYLIDDDPSVRDALGLLLGVRGYRTAVFAGGEDFVKAWQPEWAGCVLIDIRMPGMDGLELQQKLSDMGCHLPVIVI